MDYLSLTIKELHEALVKKEITPLELTKQAIKEIKENKDNAIETLMEKEALDFASSLNEPEIDNPFWGIPVVVKDNYSTKGVLTTASSEILKDYVPVFDATVVSKLKEAKAVIIAKTTLDELAMGGTGMTGHLGWTYNPYDPSHERQIGGSSCGSAALCAAGIVPFALGSDTGDSVRKPASYGGLVGFKPTWGRISRWGLFPFAPSLDHVGYFTRSVYDAAISLNLLAGRDNKDSTSSNVDPVDYTHLLNCDIKGKKIAVIQEIIDAFDQKYVTDKFNEVLEALKNKGAIINYVHMSENLLKSILPTYLVISCAEATSNNACLDGVKYGPRYGGNTYEEVMYNARTKGFSKLIKRRFIIGSFSLLRENQKDLFEKAQRNRHKIVDQLNKILEDNDVIFLPAAPTVAPKFEGSSDQLSNEYLIAENHLGLGNFSGLPSITLPIGMHEGLPFGANFMGHAYKEDEVLSFASSVEEITGLRNLSVKKVN
ncbi:MAG: Asp-tRNA(Asn)/Glu-tRNA(Gln) amidotransferase subunit GatA [Bacilli bacterium]|nr:Asp-tRNA(Asn)/Glu-tRNA(Gln) amidotransferase subunit GatA [Bacilli bacterium]